MYLIQGKTHEKGSRNALFSGLSPEQQLWCHFRSTASGKTAAPWDGLKPVLILLLNSLSPPNAILIRIPCLEEWGRIHIKIVKRTFDLTSLLNENVLRCQEIYFDDDLCFCVLRPLLRHCNLCSNDVAGIILQGYRDIWPPVIPSPGHCAGIIKSCPGTENTEQALTYAHHEKRANSFHCLTSSLCWKSACLWKMRWFWFSARPCFQGIRIVSHSPMCFVANLSRGQHICVLWNLCHIVVAAYLNEHLDILI